MDNITHTVMAVALAEAGLKRVMPLPYPRSCPVWLLILGANGPDIDVLAGLGGNGARYLEVHRGITHSFAGAPFVAAISAAIVWLWHRRRKPESPFAWPAALILAFIGVLSHLLLDFITPYGT